ncbi:aldehyde dehydrogenase family protein, partial [Paraburkholderia sp. SIMBA_030]
MSSITGAMLIGAQSVRGQAGEMRAFAPALGQDIEPAFGLGNKADVARACELAAQAFDAFRAAPHETRAKLLEAIAERILAIGD